MDGLRAHRPRVAQLDAEAVRPHALTASSVYGRFGYDAKGRRTNGGGKQIQYTELDLPRETMTSSGITAFAYDATGRWVKKAGPGGTTISIGGLYERRTDPGGTKHVFYVEGSDGIVAQIVYEQGSTKSETQYILTDAIGSVGVVTGESGQEIERRYFEPFGQRIEGNGTPQAHGATNVHLGFTGHPHDDELGLINMGGRVYDPATRRFLTADPIVLLPLFGQAYNAYAYALNSPLSITDPSGYSPSGGATRGANGGQGGFLSLYRGSGAPSRAHPVRAQAQEPTGGRFRAARSHRRGPAGQFLPLFSPRCRAGRSM